MKEQKVVLITGSNSGLGMSIALLFARKGMITYASMRTMSKGQELLDIAKKENLNLNTIRLDVTNNASIAECMNTIVEKEGRIDILVNNAGRGYAGFLMEIPEEDLKHQFETNFFGMFRVSKEAAKHMIKKRSGTIVNISGGNGIVAFPGIGAYSTCKFAIEGLSELLYYELGHFGIKVRDIVPGAIKTGFVNRMDDFFRNFDKENGIYPEYYEHIENFYNKNNKTAAPSEKAAKVVYKAAMSRRNKFRRSCLGKSRLLFIMRKLFPDFIVMKIISWQSLGKVVKP